ncbi:MAG TPA: S-adenosylmethionine decarboxylase [Deinococcales bacterium]|nr:S-adenosylmethionine decarboxylase [Deinococcales bacterium]
METLGYGTHLTVDVFQADLSEFVAPEQVLELLRELAASIESGANEVLEVPVVAADGSSVAVLGSESQLFMHVFPGKSTASLRIFTRLDSTLAAVIETIREKFRTGRTESHVSMVSKVVPRERQLVETVLRGDRGYVLARLEAIAGAD